MNFQLMYWFDHCQLQLVRSLTLEHCPTRNLPHKISQTSFNTFDQWQYLLCTLHKSFFFCFSVAFLPFLIKHNMPKCCFFSSLFNIKMSTQKFTNFDFFLNRCTVRWQLSQYNLTKLCWMKLKTPECY